MTVSVIQTSSNNMADSLNTDVGSSHKLKLYTAADGLLATMTYAAATGTVSTVSGAEAITWSEASYTDESSATAGTVSYAIITTSADAEIIRFSDPSTELSLSSLNLSAGDAVNVTADVVVKLPNST